VEAANQLSARASQPQESELVGSTSRDKMRSC
jgi:hypothetical protein